MRQTKGFSNPTSFLTTTVHRSNCLTLWLYFPDSPWCFLSLHGCLKAMPYPRAATLITGGHTNTCVHTALETAGALGTWNTYIKRKTLRAVTMEISESKTPSAEVCPQNRLRVWVGVCVWDTVDELMEAYGSQRQRGLPQSVGKENKDKSLIVWRNTSAPT